MSRLADLSFEHQHVHAHGLSGTSYLFLRLEPKRDQTTLCILVSRHWVIMSLFAQQFYLADMSNFSIWLEGLYLLRECES